MQSCIGRLVCRNRDRELGWRSWQSWSLIPLHSVLCCLQVTNWSGTCYIFPLLGAFIADSYLGRYRTIIIFSIIYIIVSHHRLLYVHTICSCLRY